TPSVTVVPNPAGAVATGTLVGFTATLLDSAGSSAVYKWYKNGIPVLGSKNFYSFNRLNNGDSIWCIVTTSKACQTTNTATSNKVIAQVTTSPYTIVTTGNGCLGDTLKVLGASAATKIEWWSQGAIYETDYGPSAGGVTVAGNAIQGSAANQ